MSIPALVNPLSFCPTVAHRLENSTFYDTAAVAWNGAQTNTDAIQNSLYFDGASSSVGFTNAVLQSSQATFAVRAAAVADHFQRSLLTVKAVGVGTIQIVVVNGVYSLQVY